jgi:hypothetical protein
MRGNTPRLRNVPLRHASISRYWLAVQPTGIGELRSPEAYNPAAVSLHCGLISLTPPLVTRPWDCPRSQGQSLSTMMHMLSHKLQTSCCFFGGIPLPRWHFLKANTWTFHINCGPSAAAITALRILVITWTVLSAAPRRSCLRTVNIGHPAGAGGRTAGLSRTISNPRCA